MEHGEDALTPDKLKEIFTKTPRSYYRMHHRTFMNWRFLFSSMGDVLQTEISCSRM
jgi:hypothetical protein